MYFKRIPKWLRLIYSRVIWDKRDKGRTLYLTFDDGPDSQSSRKIGAVLKALNIKATFFCLGEKVDSHLDICQYLKDEGHVLANHNFTHLNGWQTENGNYIEGVIACQKILEEYKLTNRKLYRPPYGKLKLSQIRKIGLMGFDMINWTLMPGDFEKSISNETLLNRLSQCQNGDIIVLHDSYEIVDKLIEILPVFVESALQRGFNFKTL